MQVLFVAFVCLCLAVTTWAQRPKPCMSPPLLVGAFSLAGPNGTVGSIGKYSYDAYARRIRFNRLGYDQSGMYNKDVLMLFNEGVSYEINWLNFTCTKRALKTPFHPMEVPKDAALMGQVVAGSSSGFGQGVLVNTWIAEDPETQTKYMTTFTEVGCVPMTTMYYTAETGWMALSMFNHLIGIADPQQFFPHPICDSAQLEGATDFFGALL